MNLFCSIQSLPWVFRFFNSLYFTFIISSFNGIKCKNFSKYFTFFRPEILFLGREVKIEKIWLKPKNFESKNNKFSQADKLELGWIGGKRIKWDWDENEIFFQMKRKTMNFEKFLINSANRKFWKGAKKFSGSFT